MTKRIYPQEHIDFMLQLLRDPKRIVAMGLGPTVLEAARRGGGKPRPECTSKPAAAKSDNVVDFEARRRAKLKAKASRPVFVDGVGFDFDALGHVWVKAMQRCAQHPEGTALGDWGRSGLPNARRAIDANERGPK